MAKDRSEYNRRYWAEHKEEIGKKRKERYKKEKNKILGQHKRWVDNNREHWNTYQREYRKRKKEELDKLNNN